MKEIAILSGKGGTGKTSLTACFALLAENPVIADVDVDAADLHLILSPNIKEQHDFISGKEATIREDTCTNCGACLNLCNFDAIRERQGKHIIDPLSCEGCGVCARFCPFDAVDFTPRLCGQWMISETRNGPMVHASLGIAAENSGRLVALVREKAKEIAEKNNHDLIILDGPPGIGCPVIAALSGLSLAVIVTEPTVSGLHDLERLYELTEHFDVPTALCINKWDLCPDMAETIKQRAKEAGSTYLGKIRYDMSFTEAQTRGKAVIEIDSPCCDDIHKIWKKLTEVLS